jgi:GTP-binding protein Era
VEKGETRFGFVAVLGAPNAGKSTLVNALVGSKVSIVTRKVQTTRMQVRGIVNRGSCQMVLVDTPGIFVAKRRLDRAMIQSAWKGAADADMVLVLVDAAEQAKRPDRQPTDDTKRLIEGLLETGRKAVLVLNKIDSCSREALLPVAERMDQTGAFERIFMVSALDGEGLEDLASYCAAKMPAGPWHYPEDQTADIPSRLLAAEVTREKLYLRLHEELPYASTVITDSWTERADGSVRIDQTIYVEREGQKAIVIGKGGQTIKAIGEAARREMTEIFDRRVHLFLHTKVAERWGDQPNHYLEMGLIFPKNQ